MKCIFICPYFGKLPNNFQLWLNSWANNREYNICIITDDDTDYLYPENVRVEYLPFEKLASFIQSKFDFHIEIKSPYKLCDLKPAYGYIFSEYITGYEFWGHCDMDIIIGDLDNFLTAEIFTNYKKILFLGHMTIYKNELEMNRMFMKKIIDYIDYKKIFSSSSNFAFDELPAYGINSIFYKSGIDIFNSEIYADISSLYNNLYRDRYSVNSNSFRILKEKQIFTYENGKIFSYLSKGNSIEKKEYAYIHLQKRDMTLKVNPFSDHYLILPHSFEPFIKPNLELINENSNYNKLRLSYIKIKYSALKRKLSKNVELFKFKHIKEGEGK